MTLTRTCPPLRVTRTSSASCLLCLVEDVAERPAVADGDVEAVVGELREVDDVSDDRLDVGEAPSQEIELAGRDV